MSRRIVRTVTLQLPDSRPLELTIAQLRALHQVADGQRKINRQTAAVLEREGLIHDLEGITAVLTPLGHQTAAAGLPDIPTPTHQHGTNACYVIDQCRCRPCSKAASAYRGRLHRQNTYGTPRTVDAAPVRAHVEWLQTNGIGLKTIARVSGVSHGSLSKLIYGSSTGGGPRRTRSSHVRTATAERLYAVGLEHLADGATVPAAPTWVRINQMVDAGFTKTELAPHIHGPGARAIQLGRKTVTARNARNVAVIHRRWTQGDLHPRRQTKANR